MKLLHSADWHLGARTGGIDRTEDLFARIGELAAIIDHDQIDCLVIAGDVFDEARSDRLPALFGRLGGILGPRIAEGLSVVAVAGNHDREHVFPLLRTATALMAPYGGAGRVTFTERPDLVQVTSRDGTEAVQVACIPYPTHARYGLAAGGWPSRDAKHAELSAAVRRAIAELGAAADTNNAGVPVILAGHILISGTQARLYCMTEADDVPVDSDELPRFAYVALGHIHAPTALSSDSIRYCGSIERMDRGETDDCKEALVVTIRDGRKVDTKSVALNACPFVTVTAATVEDLVVARDEMADPHRSMVSLTIDADAASMGALVHKARELFPRLYGPVIRRRAAGVVGASVAGFDRGDVAGTVRGWLTRNLADDPDAPALRALADELLAGLNTSAETGTGGPH
jgi:exonuclease SbcD